jgi:chitin disaccharide deacetylase
MTAARSSSAMVATPPTAAGLLIVNADDWGRDPRTTQMMHDCVRRGSVSSVSAMVFMEDSERAAEVALKEGIDAGLHLNFTTPFTGNPGSPLIAQQEKLTRYLRRHRLAQVMYHPGLKDAFAWVVKAQIDEYRRLYGVEPHAVDGHHHMHLCENVIAQQLIPAGALVRRNFSFQPGEKGGVNRAYRAFIDRRLERRHKTVDFLFNLNPLHPERLGRIFELARESVVELETHPAESAEYRFLMDGELFRRAAQIRLASHATWSKLSSL